MDTGCADSAENSRVHSNGEDVFSAALHKLVKMVLLFVKMVIACSVLYYISYRPLVYVLLIAVD